MKKNMNNLGFAIAVCSAFLSLNGASAKDKKVECNISTPATLSEIVATVSESSFCEFEKNVENIGSACKARIIALSNGDPEQAENLKCSSPTRMHARSPCGSHFSSKDFDYASMDIIKTIPLSITQAMKMKCDKIASCILNSNTAEEIGKLKQIAQAIECQ